MARAVSARCRVGLTGGIGSGKSAAAGLFARLGVEVIDTDAIAHALTAPGGAAMPAIREAFGARYVAADGSLDRAAMRRLAFSDKGAKQRLEAILHPMIRAELERRAAAATSPYVVLAIPLLVETGAWRQAVDRVLVIDCPEALQIERVLARNGLPREQVEAIIAVQAFREQRLAIADDVIVNDGSLAGLEQQVASLHARYLAESCADRL